MQNQLAVSSYCFRKLLGPIRIQFRGPDGSKSIFTWGEPSETPITLLELPALLRDKLGITAIEICQFHFLDDSPEYVAQLQQALTDAGVSLINMPIDVGNISDMNPTFRDEDLAEIEGWMKVAATLGSRFVRVNASNPMAGDAAPIEVTIASYRRLARTAESLGMQLLLENHGGITADPEVMVQLLEAVGPTHLKTLVDIGNFEPWSSAHDPCKGAVNLADLDLTPLYAGLARIAPYAGYVHAKTHDFDENGKPIVIDVVKALRIVRDTGFTGPIALEYEGNNGDPWENTARTKALVEEAFG
jgi:sugar phosphate isomerase/epimerase